MPNINFYSPQTGRRIKEDNSIINTADMIEAIYNKIVNGQVDMQLSGRYVKQSTDPRPTGKEGDQLYLWDTRQVFLHDGTDWREV